MKTEQKTTRWKEILQWGVVLLMPWPIILAFAGYKFYKRKREQKKPANTE